MTTGTCKYCGNLKTVNAEEGLHQDNYDIIASMECNCEGARFARKKAADFETTSAYIDNLIDKEDLAKAIKGFIEPLQDYKAMSLSVKIDDVTKFSMSVGQDGALSVQRVNTLKTQYDTK